MAAKPKPRPVPRGPALHRPDLVLMSLRDTNGSDIADGDAFFRQDAPEPFGTMISAPVEEDDG